MLVGVIVSAEGDRRPRVAVMNLGQFSGAFTSDFSAENLGAAAADYLTEALTDSGKFFVAAQDHIAEKMAAANLQISGDIPPSMARKIAAALDVDYVIFGTLNGVNGDTMKLEVLSSGANVHTVRAIMVVEMMYAKTGRLIVVRGEGASKSSLVKAGTDAGGVVTIGRKKISQDSVDSAIRKAAFAAAEALTARAADFVAEND